MPQFKKLPVEEQELVLYNKNKSQLWDVFFLLIKKLKKNHGWNLKPPKMIPTGKRRKKSSNPSIHLYGWDVILAVTPPGSLAARPWKRESSLSTTIFQGRAVKLREGNLYPRESIYIYMNTICLSFFLSLFARPVLLFQLQVAPQQGTWRTSNFKLGAACFDEDFWIGASKLSQWSNESGNHNFFFLWINVWKSGVESGILNQ